MAIRVLLDHGVPQDHIIFVTFLVARNVGIKLLEKAFPQIKVICAAVDDELNEAWLEPSYEGEGQTGAEARRVWVVEPGMGHIGANSLILLSSDIADRITHQHRRPILPVILQSATRLYGYPLGIFGHTSMRTYDKDSWIELSSLCMKG